MQSIMIEMWRRQLFVNSLSRIELFKWSIFLTLIVYKLNNIFVNKKVLSMQICYSGVNVNSVQTSNKTPSGQNKGKLCDRWKQKLVKRVPRKLGIEGLKL